MTTSASPDSPGLVATAPPSTAPASTGPGPDEGEVLAAVTRMLGEVIGEDEMFGIEVEMATTFNDDLELESIEFVALAELLQEEWGDQVDFVAFIAEMELDDIIGMTVGTLVTYVTGRLDGSVLHLAVGPS